MHIVVFADDAQKKILLLKKVTANVTFEFLSDRLPEISYAKADVLFLLKDDLNINEIKIITSIPVFINSVILTLQDLPDNIHRVNAWPAFLERNMWEIATKNVQMIKQVFESIGWQYIITPDKPGFIAARVISMIINEAYFAYEEQISSKEEIDLAMCLGTNYPFGPFEWATKIGLNNILKLLEALGEHDDRYLVSAVLKQEART